LPRHNLFILWAQVSHAFGSAVHLYISLVYLYNVAYLSWDNIPTRYRIIKRFTVYGYRRHRAQSSTAFTIVVFDNIFVIVFLIKPSPPYVYKYNTITCASWRLWAGRSFNFFFYLIDVIIHIMKSLLQGNEFLITMQMYTTLCIIDITYYRKIILYGGTIMHDPNMRCIGL